MKIKICKKFSNINKLEKKLEKAFPDDKVIVKSCVSMCKQCKDQPVAKVDGKKKKAKSISRLIDKIDKH